MRLVALLAICLCGISSSAVAQDFSGDELAAAEQLQRREIAEAENSIAEIEADKKVASKNGDRDAVRRLSNDLRLAKQKLSATKKLAVEEFARIAAQRKLDAEAEKKRVRDERDAAMAQAAEAHKQNAERLNESGGCPLELTRVNFVHTSGRASGIVPGEFGDRTVIALDVANRSDKQVEAFEVRCVLKNGFDDVLREHKFVGAIVDPLEHKKALLTAAPQSETAVKMTVFIERVKMANGDIWQREPEHKHVSLSIENLEGGVIRLPR